MPIKCLKGCLPLISFLDPDQVLAAFQVNLGTHGSALHTISDLIQQKQGVSVQDGDPVEASVVHT